jgi:Phage-related minor tail protein
MDSTATLVIRIETAMTKLRSELARVEREVARTADAIGREVGQADSVIGSLGTSLRANLPAIIAEGLAKAADFVGQTLDGASALRAAADASGIAVEQYQRLDYALRQAGLGQGQFDSALDAFLPKLGEALQESGAAAAAMQRLGVSVRDAGGEVRTTDAVLLDVADGLARLESPAERAGIASQLFGDRAGPDMALALSQGGQAIRDLGKDASVLEEGMVRSADEINKRWQTLTNTIGTGVKGAVLDVVQATVSAVDRIGASLDESARQRRAENLEKALKSGDVEDLRAAHLDLIEHGEVSYPVGPTRGRAWRKPAAPLPRRNPRDTGSLNDPPVPGIEAFDRNAERRRVEAERAEAERKAETDRRRAEQVEAAAEHDGGRDRAR